VNEDLTFVHRFKYHVKILQHTVEFYCHHVTVMDNGLYLLTMVTANNGDVIYFQVTYLSYTHTHPRLEKNLGFLEKVFFRFLKVFKRFVKGF